MTAIQRKIKTTTRSRSGAGSMFSLCSLSVALTLLAISCNTKITPQPAGPDPYVEGREIGFIPWPDVMTDKTKTGGQSTKAGGQDTKATIEDGYVLGKDAEVTNRGFGVVGHYSIEVEEDFNTVTRWIQIFDNQLVTSVLKSGLVPGTNGYLDTHWDWIYSPLKYWRDRPFRFFAYYPHDAAATLDGAKPKLVLDKCFEAEEKDVTFSISDYTVTAPDADGKQTDFLLAQPAFEQGSLDRTEPVNLKFSHALCQVTFKVVLNDQTTKKMLSCESLSVNDIYSTGTVTVARNPSTDPNDKSTWTWPITWSEPSNKTFYPYTLNAPTEETVNMGDPAVETKRLTYTVTQYVLMMPQAFENNVQRVGIKISDADSGLSKDLVAYFKTATSDPGWAPGKKYKYELTTTVKSEDLITAIDLALTLAKWEDVNIEATL